MVNLIRKYLLTVNYLNFKSLIIEYKYCISLILSEACETGGTKGREAAMSTTWMGAEGTQHYLLRQKGWCLCQGAEHLCVLILLTPIRYPGN